MPSRYYQGAAMFAVAAALASGAAATPNGGADQLRKIPGGFAIIPYSSQPNLADPSQAHTNYEIFSRTGQFVTNSAPLGKGETPASLACIYGLTPKVKHCNPLNLTKVAKTGSKTIAIVDAYDDPTAANDLAAYSKQFGLPAVTSNNFKIIYASGKKPVQDSSGGWEAEEQLDIEMAHAMAPGAQIILVEASSTSLTSLVQAEKVAIKAVAAAGGGEVSNSWGANEYAKEAALAPDFAGDNVVVFAAAGDTPGVSVPAVLPNVVSVGGTTISRNAAYDYLTQGTWAFGGGGISSYIPVPSYQSGTAAVSAVVGKWRGTPDISFDANNLSGVFIYDTTPYRGTVPNWILVGGTSVASPAVAGIVNSAGSFNVSGAAELAEMYANLSNTAAFTDITVGQCPNDIRGRAEKGYDLCTGIGTPFGAPGK